MAKELNDTDYELPADQTSVWIGVDDVSVYIHRTDEGVVVDLFPKGKEMDDAVASTYVFNDEIVEALGGEYIDDWYCRECSHGPIDTAEDNCPSCGTEWGEEEGRQSMGAIVRSRLAALVTRLSAR